MTSAMFPDTNIFLLLSIAAAAGYLSGSVPYGLLVGKIFGVGDIRRSGSGNIGATNMLRVGGRKLAALTLVLDALKGSVPVIVFKACSPECALIAGFGAFIGHLFPVWLGFKGGKGVATAIGILLGLCWKAGLAVMATWLLMAALFRFSSLAALVAIGFSPVFAMLWGTPDMAALALVVSAMVWGKHHANIRRLFKGTEPRIGDSKKEGATGAA